MLENIITGSMEFNDGMCVLEYEYDMNNRTLYNYWASDWHGNEYNLDESDALEMVQEVEHKNEIQDNTKHLMAWLKENSLDHMAILTAMDDKLYDNNRLQVMRKYLWDLFEMNTKDPRVAITLFSKQNFSLLFLNSQEVYDKMFKRYFQEVRNEYF